jgi:hypothetical protein
MSRRSSFSDFAPVSVPEDDLTDLRATTDSESDRLQSILSQIQSIQSLPSSEQRTRLEQLIRSLQQDSSKEQLQQLLDTLDSSLSNFMGDPRRFVSAIGQILTCLEQNPEQTQMALQSFVQSKQITSAPSPAPFDWTMVDILLSQLSGSSGDSVAFTSEMLESILSTLFPPSGEQHFLQDLVSQFLLMSIGEQVFIVRSRMRWLSEAPLRKVTVLSNMVSEIHERYERELEKLRSPNSDEAEI